MKASPSSSASKAASSSSVCSYLFGDNFSGDKPGDGGNDDDDDDDDIASDFEGDEFASLVSGSGGDTSLDFSVDATLVANELFVVFLKEKICALFFYHC